MTTDIVTYPEANAKIVELLRWHEGNSMLLYAATRIEELEAKAERLLERAQRAEAEIEQLRERLRNVRVPSILREHAANLSGFLGKTTTTEEANILETRVQEIRQLANTLEERLISE